MPKFQGGINIAMKIPKAQYEQTLAFYRDLLGWELKEEAGEHGPTISRSVSVEFGPNKLWLDQVDSFARSDVWLELETDDLDGAASRLADAGIPLQDQIEPLPAGMRAHWIANPAGVMHLLCQPSSGKD